MLHLYFHRFIRLFYKRNRKSFSVLPLSFSKNLVVYYCKCCNLIGYATLYLFVNRYRVTRQGRVFRRKTMLIPCFLKDFLRNNEHKFVFTKLDYSV